MSPPRRAPAGIVLLLLAAWPGVAQTPANCQQDVCVEVEQDEASARLVVKNDRYSTVLIQLQLTRTLNVRPSEPTPLTRVVPPRSRTPLLNLDQVVRSQEWDYDYDWDPSYGDPSARHDAAARYRLPFEGTRPRLVLQSVGGPFSHTGAFQYSFDFEMPEDSLVLAAREGIVVRVVQGFAESGSSRAWRDKANLVTVLHADGTFGDYVHLRPQGSLVREGDRVRVGQPIARSGNTGFTVKPHLHFMVWKATPDGKFQSLPVRFDDGTAEGYVPREGLWYGNVPVAEAGPPAVQRASARSGS